MRAVIALSDALGMTTVAEGVEVPLQQHFLAAQGCPLAQGRLFGDALPAAAMTRAAARRGPPDRQEYEPRSASRRSSARLGRRCTIGEASSSPSRADGRRARAHAAVLITYLADAGWQIDPEHADGADALSAALHAPRLERRPLRRRRPGRRTGPQGARARAPHRPPPPLHRGVAVRARRRPVLGHPRARRCRDRRLGPGQLARRLTRELDAAGCGAAWAAPTTFCSRSRRSPTTWSSGSSPRRCASACWPRSARRSAGAWAWSGGTARRTRCCAAPPWHADDASPEMIAFAEDSRAQSFAPGQGLPGRVWAFRRPSWVSDVSRDARLERAGRAGRRDDDRGGLPARRRRRLRRRDRVLLARRPRAQRRDLGHVRHRRRPARLLPRPLRPRGGREPPPARAAGPHARLPRRRGGPDRGPRPSTASSCWPTPAPARRSASRRARCSAATGSRSRSPRPGRRAARTAFEQLVCGEADTLAHRLPSADRQRRAITWHGTTLDDGAGVLMLGHAEVVARRAALAVAS